MTENELNDATKALKAWFKSQNIEPADAGVMMVSLIAELLVYKTRDIDELALAIRLHTDFLAIEIAGELRK